MKRLLFVLALMALATPAYADGLALTYKDVSELTDLDGASVADGDFFILYDASAKDFVKTSAEGFAEVTASINGLTATATELNAAVDLSVASEIATADPAPAQSECGKTIFLNSTTEFATTLPAPLQGCKFSVVVKAAPSGADYTIVTTGADIIYGNSVSGDGALNASAEDTISLKSGSAVVGDRVDLFSDGTNWYATAITFTSAGITFTSAI